MSPRVTRVFRSLAIALVSLAGAVVVLERGLTFVLRRRPRRTLAATRWVFGRFANPVLLWLSERLHIEQSLVFHTGRVSGREYATPLCVSPTPDGFIVPAAFGREADWFRNLASSTEARLVHEGRTYRVEPQVIGAAEALRSAGGTPGCSCWESLRIEDFVLLRPIAEESTGRAG